MEVGIQRFIDFELDGVWKMRKSKCPPSQTMALLLMMPLCVHSQTFSDIQFSVVNSEFGQWTKVTPEMLKGSAFDDYPTACGELVIGDGSKIILLYKAQNKNVDYLVVHVTKNGKSIKLMQDSWPTGNPSSFISPNGDSSFVDIKTNKKWIINPKKSFIFDEWAYRWVIAEANGKWVKILIKSEE